MTVAQKVAIESWDPEYGVPSAEHPGDETDVVVDPDIEIPAARWSPIAPGPATGATRIAFIDGVRRIDANAWIEDGIGPVRQGMFASFAAGAVRAAEHAHVDAIEVRRGLFAPGNPQAFATNAGKYQPFAVAGPGPELLAAALQERLGALEIEVAGRLPNEADLIVVDGPLYGRQHLPRTVGYIKRHHVHYLAGQTAQTVAELAPGERTPLFRFRTSWTRHSWYLRLPGPMAHAWSGIVRLEAPADLSVDRCAALAELSCQVLPRFASAPHKDPRAPQNLYPIAGLERELRRRLGDPRYVERALRVAAGRPAAHARSATNR